MAGFAFLPVIAGLDQAIHDELQQQKSVRLRKMHLAMDRWVKPGDDQAESLRTHTAAR